mmetsp:Transcript_31633/g.67403  ORF Transcript_31633/g.67403 Transcript_31633/m.67403 type:complete len:130 (-) Transcript_31633:820-1209(-)
MEQRLHDIPVALERLVWTASQASFSLSFSLYNSLINSITHDMKYYLHTGGSITSCPYNHTANDLEAHRPSKNQTISSAPTPATLPFSPPLPTISMLLVILLAPSLHPRAHDARPFDAAPPQVGLHAGRQ